MIKSKIANFLRAIASWVDHGIIYRDKDKSLDCEHFAAKGAIEVIIGCRGDGHYMCKKCAHLDWQAF